MLTAEGYLNYRQEPRVVLRSWSAPLWHLSLHDAEEFMVELQSAIEAAKEQRRLLDIAEDAHDSRKAEGM